MSRSPFIKSIVAVSLLSSNVTFAGDGGLAGGAPTAPQAQKQVLEIEGPDGKPLCQLKMTGKSFRDDLKVAVVTESTGTPQLDAIVDAMTNGTRQIAVNEFSKTNPDEISQLRTDAAKQLGQQIAGMILTPENLGKEDALLTVQEILSTLVGQLPTGSFESLKAVNEASISKINSKDTSSQESEQRTKNSLAEIIKLVSEYRAAGFNINTGAKIADTLSKIWLINKIPGVTSVGDTLRTRFQTVNDGIKVVSDTLVLDLAKMRLSVQQLKQARLDAVSMEEYLRLSVVTIEEVERLAKEHEPRVQALNDPKALGRYQKHILLPIAARKQAIHDMRFSITLAYEVFVQLMDQYLDLIMFISNLRPKTEMDITTVAASKIKTAELNDIRQMAEKLNENVNGMRSDLVADLRINGMQIREIPNKIAASSQASLAFLEAIEAEARLNLENIPKGIETLNRSSALLQAKLDITNASIAHQSYIRIADSLAQTAKGRAQRSVEEVNKIETAVDAVDAKVKAAAATQPQQ